MGSVIYIPKKANPIFYPEYGALYNWWAATDARKITSSDDWVVPSESEYVTMLNLLGTRSSNSWTPAGDKLKEIGTVYWSTNPDATNETGYNARGAGERTTAGIFTGLQSFNFLRTKTPISSSISYVINIEGGAHSAGYIGSQHLRGYSIRLLYTGAGTPTSYTGNDGRVYRVVTIGTQTWLADNLMETRFRNGDIIPWHGATPASYFTNAEWAALTTAGVCAYNNTLSNVATGFTFPT